MTVIAVLLWRAQVVSAEPMATLAKGNRNARFEITYPQERMSLIQFRLQSKLHKAPILTADFCNGVLMMNASAVFGGKRWFHAESTTYVPLHFATALMNSSGAGHSFCYGPDKNFEFLLGALCRYQ